MSKVYDTIFTSSEQQFLSSKLFKYNVMNDCHIWYSSTNSDGYPIIRPNFRSKSQTFTVHRLIYFLGNNCHFSNSAYHVSHRCHTKLCIKLEHLSLEPSEINNERNLCRPNRTCKGHDGYENCIF